MLDVTIIEIIHPQSNKLVMGNVGICYEKCRKHSPAAHVFYISLVFSNARRVLSQCNTRLRLLYLSIIRKFPYNACPDWLKQRALSENRARVDDGMLAAKFLLRNFDKFVCRSVTHSKLNLLSCCK